MHSRQLDRHRAGELLLDLPLFFVSIHSHQAKERGISFNRG